MYQHRDYTNYNRGKFDDFESDEDLELRYNMIKTIISSYIEKCIDIICLQEVDYLLYRLLDKVNYKGYKLVYSRDVSKLWKPKNIYGPLTIVNINNYTIISTNIQKITPIKFSSKSKISLNIKLEKSGDIIEICNTHLTGSNRSDIRKIEIDNIIKNLGKDNIKIICGDLNERNHFNVEEVIKNMDLYFVKDS